METSNNQSLDLFTEDSVRDLVAAICIALVEHGINCVHVGGLMRLIGVDEDTAAEHDDEIMVLEEQFETESDTEESDKTVPAGTVIH
jgi:hypothetical protein